MKRSVLLVLLVGLAVLCGCVLATDQLALEPAPSAVSLAPTAAPATSSPGTTPTSALGAPQTIAPARTTPPDFTTYSDPEAGFALDYPREWELCQDTGLSRLFCRKQPQPTGPSFPEFYVTVLPQGFNNEDASAYNFLSEADVRAFAALSTGQSHDTNPLPDYWTYVRLPDTTVDGQAGLVVENSKVWEGGANTKDRRVLVAVGTTTYMLGTYYETPAELAEFERMLAGFRFDGPE